MHAAQKNQNNQKRIDIIREVFNIMSKSTLYNVNVKRDDTNETLLFSCLKNEEYAPAILLLQDSNLDVNAVSGEYRATALMLAVQMVSFLNLTDRSEQKITMLMETIELLLGFENININAEDSMQRCALSFATSRLKFWTYINVTDIAVAIQQSFLFYQVFILS